jgi:Predicted pyridoxal phosphate-dependent enzyme apparently involved in regulation of cell wall biogenesis
MRKGNELPPTAGLPLRWGDFVRAPARSFTQGLSDCFGLPDPLFTCSGTAALLVALQTLKQRAPDRTDVIIPAYTCPLVPLAVQLAPGLRAVPCDIIWGGIDFDPEALSSICGRQTLAVVPTHLGGKVADVATAGDIATRCGATVLEDAAQALGAKAGDKSVGLTGDVSFFSLAAGKGLTTYEGGILCAKSPSLRAELAATAARLLKPSLRWTIRRNLELLGYTALYTPSRLNLVYGRNLRNMLEKGDEEAAVGDYFTPADIPLHSLDIFRQRIAANALERLPEFLESGATRAAKRLDALRHLESVQVIADRPDTRGVWPFFMVLLPGREQRDRALAGLWRAGLGVTKLFVRALPEYSFLASCFEAGYGDCPNARDMADRMLTVTNTHWLDEEHFIRITASLRESL